MAYLAHPPRCPASRGGFEIAIICALTLEVDAVKALFDNHWDDNDPPYDKAPGDRNAYSTGVVGRHNVVLAHMPGMGKANAASVAAHCLSSFPNIKLALVVGVCGAVPFHPDGAEIVLGDVIVSDGVVQYDLGRQLPGQFVQKDTLLDSLGRPNAEIRSFLSKLKSIYDRKALREKMTAYLEELQAEPELEAGYPGTVRDKLFEATYRHVSDGMSCDECRCDGPLVPRRRLEQGNPQPTVHFGLIASGDTVMKSGEDRDRIARQKDIVSFEMESAGVWDIFPCVVIKGACDYADSHKSKGWQRYAAATAAACMKAFLSNWAPSLSLHSERPAGPWFLVPYPRNDIFIGRESILKTLQHPLKPNSQARASLFGLGGIGKTQIALEYAYWLRETCADVSVFWVHGSNAERFRQSYTSIALECRTPGYDDPKKDVLPLVKEWLERKDQGQWLMVIDNADDAQLFFPSTQEPKDGGDKEYLGEYIPECAHGSILVTTRNKQAGLKLAKTKPLIEINTMNDVEAKGLLCASLGYQEDQLLELACRLEHLPLALVQAAAYIMENTIKVSEYLRILDKSDQDLVSLLSEEFETAGRDSKTPRAVAETWILSFEQIQRQNAFASELFSLMSFFDRQAIPIEFLDYYSEQQDQEKHGEKRLQKALGVLKAFSFVTAGYDQSLNVHRLVQLVSRKWLEREKKMKHFAGQALLAVSHAFPFGTYENWVICGKYLPHVYQVLKFEGTGSRDERMRKWRLLHNTASYLHDQGQWEEAERLQLEAVKMGSEVLGSKDSSTLTSMANLASMYSNQGRWEEAEKLFVQVMETRKPKLGADHPDTLTIMGNLASTYSNQGRWEEAEKLFVQVMETLKSKLGADHPDTLTNMGNLASTYMNQGRWEEAEKLNVQVMETLKSKFRADHPDTLTVMCNLASTYMNQGRWEEAEKLFVQVMETRKSKLGADHPDTLTSMSNLASTLGEQGRWEEAEKLNVQAMETRKSKLGADHPDTLTSMGNLASMYSSQGRWEEAEKLFVQVMETRKSKLRADHPDTLTIMGNLASTYMNQGRWEEAEKLNVQVMETRKSKLGADHPDTLTIIGNLASTYSNQGRWEEAEKLNVQVMETLKAELGADHPDTLTSMNNLAFTWKRMGRHEDAVNLMDTCFNLQNRVLRPLHPHTVSTLQTLVEWRQEEWTRPRRNRAK